MLDRARRPVQWVPLSGRELAIECIRSEAEQRARTTAFVGLAAAQIGTSGVLAGAMHARGRAAGARPRTGDYGYHTCPAGDSALAETELIALGVQYYGPARGRHLRAPYCGQSLWGRRRRQAWVIEGGS
jgi:hypothetical protein